MKRIFLFFAMVVMSVLAMARNSANELVTNQSISIEISVLNGSNTAVYTETQTVTTNANGVATLVIGEGTATKGTFAGIDWSAGNYYLQTTANLGSGASAIVGTTPLLSVPYALYAEKAGNADVDMSEYAEKSELTDYAKTEDLSDYYKKSDVDALLAELTAKIQQLDEQLNLPEGAIYGKFSVSADKQVYFSQGNLQYQASTNTWRFAENQYDIIGGNNSNISSTYSGWIDLFGWGTSGYNGKNPYMTSTDYSDYGVVGDAYADIAGTNYDWGVNNAISNGGNTKGQWRTLTYEEWNYVLSERTDASALKGSATVNGVTGMILLPDNWTTPESITFTNGMNGFSNNTYTTSDWEKMEANGAVFLPTAGYRFGSDVYDVGSYGDYWSSSASNRYGCAYYLGFDYDSASMDYRNRCYGSSVRLVRGL